MDEHRKIKVLEDIENKENKEDEIPNEYKL